MHPNIVFALLLSWDAALGQPEVWFSGIRLGDSVSTLEVYQQTGEGPSQVARSERSETSTASLATTSFAPKRRQRGNNRWNFVTEGLARLHLNGLALDLLIFYTTCPLPVGRQMPLVRR